jgi:hypothetical protein
MCLLRYLCCAICLMLCLNKTLAQQGRAFRPNPHGYWYFLTPTGYGPPAKKTLLQNGMLAATQYQKTNFNGNTTTFGLIPTLLFGGDFMPIWVSAHKRIPIGVTARNPASIANLGGFFLTLPKGSEGETGRDFSLFYLNFTFGSREKNFAIGGAIAPTGFGDGIHPQAFTLHGMTRLGRRSCLVTENYIVHDRGAWIPCSMTGWRGWRGRTALDVALLITRVPAGSSASNKRLWLPIPWLAVHKTLRFDIFNRGDD